MKKKIYSILSMVYILALLIGCSDAENGNQKWREKEISSDNIDSNLLLSDKYNASVILLSDEKILVDGEVISTDKKDPVYAANDIVFYPEGQDFTYGEGTKADEHSQKEADEHLVVHITKPGNYVISGKLSAGQIAVDLSENAKKEKDIKDDKDAVVTVILNNADITCSVAPGVIFYDVYECGDDDEDDASREADTSSAGANVIIADGSENTVNGSYVAKIYKSVELNEEKTEVIDSKKLHKYDGAFYSKRSINITGEEMGDGILNINAENEGIGSELHLTINGGTININSGNDGINTNEDNVSVMTVNGGSLNITVNGSTGEGDGIDSNGWLVINGGSVVSFANSDSMDSGIDSDKGIYINGGTVIATGNMIDEIAESEQNYVVFMAMQHLEGGKTYAVKNADEELVAEVNAVNDFTNIIVSTDQITEEEYTLWADNKAVEVTYQINDVRGMMEHRMKPGMFPKGKFQPLEQ